MLVTFLFADVEGSTELLRRLGGEYPALLARYEEIVSAACVQHGGQVVDSQGDSVFAAFPAGGGLDAAAAAQRALADEPWGEGVTLRARMGVHSGEAEPVNGRYAGLAVHRAARIGSAAHGGQVLVSETTKVLADDLESPHAFRDLGSSPLKDFEQPVRLFQLTLDGLPSDFPPPRTGEPGPQRSRRRPFLLAGAVVALLLAALVAFVLLRSDDPGGLPGLSAPNSVGVIDPNTNTLVDEVPVGIRPTAITTGEGAVWVVNADDSTVSKIDPETRKVVKTIPVANVLDAVTAGEGGVWVLTSERVGGSGDTLDEAIRLDPKEGVEVARVVVRDGRDDSLAVGGVAVGFGLVWAGTLADLSAIDPATNRTSGMVPLQRTDDLAVTDSAVWNLTVVTTGTEAGSPSRLERIDPIARVLTSSTLINEGVAVAAGSGAVWVVSRAGSLIRIDATTNTVAETIPVGAGASGVAADDDGVWVANGGETTVMRIDPATNEVVATIELGIRPDKIAVGEGAVWVTAY